MSFDLFIEFLILIIPRLNTQLKQWVELDFSLKEELLATHPRCFKAYFLPLNFKFCDIEELGVDFIPSIDPVNFISIKSDFSLLFLKRKNPTKQPLNLCDELLFSRLIC